MVREREELLQNTAFLMKIFLQLCLESAVGCSLGREADLVTGDALPQPGCWDGLGTRQGREMLCVCVCPCFMCV